MSGPGEGRLRAALQRRRDGALPPEQRPREPLDLRPTTPFEQQILAEYQALRRDFEELKKRVDWLTVAIVGAALASVLERLFGP